MALFYISPKTDITAFIASATVSQGDVLLLEDGLYRRAVLITKSYVRLVANGSRVIFDGFDTLASAFILQNVTGVEIMGMKIKNYVADGILLTNTYGSRIVRNMVTSVGGDGIVLRTGTGNLFWKNEVAFAFDGIEVAGGATWNFVIENTSHHCRDDGFDCQLSQDSGNSFVGNTATDNAGTGLEIFGINSLVYGNCALDNHNGGITLFTSASSSVISNKSRDNLLSGIQVNANNCFLGDNSISDNEGRGIYVTMSYNILQENEIEFSRSNGIELSKDSSYNFVLDNELECNEPRNIVNYGEKNNFLCN